jgi:hypothetical protein
MFRLSAKCSTLMDRIGGLRNEFKKSRMDLSPSDFLMLVFTQAPARVSCRRRESIIVPYMDMGKENVSVIIRKWEYSN